MHEQAANRMKSQPTIVVATAGSQADCTDFRRITALIREFGGVLQNKDDPFERSNAGLCRLEMCRVLQVSESSYRSWRSRPISRRERTDMRVLAHIREQYSLSLGSYGRRRMTMELKEAGGDVGERRVGRLMRINGIKPVRTRRHKVTTDSRHRLGVAANWLDGDFAADVPRGGVSRRGSEWAK